VKYVIITYKIVEIGGAQQYCRNKGLYLEREGFDVIIFSGAQGKVYIDYLKRFANYIFKELSFPIYCFSKNHVDEIVSKLAMIVGYHDSEVVVESNTLATAQWAELLASRLHCKHVSFNVSEIEKASSHIEARFLKYKLDRHELFGITSESVSKMLKKYYSIPCNPSFAFYAACSNVVEDIETNILDMLPQASFNIGSIGRLEKGFVLPVLLQIKAFCEAKSGDTFNIILIGGSIDKALQDNIKRIFKSVMNANLLITGFLYPIPRKLVKSIDVFVSSSGSAMASMLEGVPTISVTPDRGDPLGILDYTTRNDVFGEKSNRSLSELLELILYSGFCQKVNRLGMLTEQQQGFDSEMRKQLSIACEGNDGNYFNVSRICSGTLKQMLYSYLCRFLGVDSLVRIQLVFSRFKQNILWFTGAKGR